MRCRLLALALLAGLSAPAAAQLPPEKALASMKPADGLQVELFAAEPMLVNPTSIDIDHLGRVWVCEAVNYRRKLFHRPPLRPEGDRIVVLTDTDGDGKADRSTVFYQGPDLMAPIGIAVAPLPSGGRQPPEGALPSGALPSGALPSGGRQPPEGALPSGALPSGARPQGANAPRSPCRVFVCQSPDILVFEDKDGDGKADGPPKKLLTGFNGIDHDHGVHGITIGPDGKLYFTVGDQGVKDLQSSDGKGRKWTTNHTDCQAGTVWRCDQDGTNLELIAHNFRNNYECCVNSFGEIWLSDNDDDGNQQTRICFVMPGGNYGYWPRGPGQSHWHEEQPGVVHKALRTGFGSPTGICFYEGTLLPERFRGELLHTDAGPRELRAFLRKPKGAGYELQKENLLTSTDTWFRPSDVCVAPDGSVFVADWYDPGVGGHGMGDWTRGRIYRVTPKGHKGYRVPPVNTDKWEGILDALGSPCLATRALAIGVIQQATKKHAIKGLRFAVQQRDKPLLQARACWLLTKIGGRIEGYWATIEAVPLTNPDFVSLHIRVFKQVLGESIADDLKPGDFSTDGTHPYYSREQLLALRDVPPDKAKRVFYPIAKVYDGKDHFLRAALNIACGTSPARRDAILADFDKHFPEWNDKVADLVWELRPKSVLPRLEKLLADGKLTAAQKGRVVDILAVNDDPAAGKAMLKLLTADHPAEVKARALENLRLFLQTKWKALEKSEELQNAIDRLLADDRTVTTGLKLIAAARYPSVLDKVAGLAGDPKAPAAVRAEAVRTLGAVPNPEAAKALAALLRDKTVAADAVAALATQAGGPPNSQSARVALAALQAEVTAADAPAESKRTALAALAGTHPGTIWLLQLKAKNQMPAELVPEAGRLLRNSPFQAERNKAMQLFPTPGKLDVAKLPSISELAKQRGSAERGKEILAKSLTGEAQCLKCHTVRGVGGHIGPDLSMIGKKASRENLFESILQPSKAIADQYVSWKVDAEDGQSVVGLIVEETDSTITVRDANGKDHRFPAKGTEKKKQLTSLMPDNLAAALTEDELIDLVEYLTTLQTAALTPDAWQIAGPFPGGANNAGLDVEHGPGQGPFDPKAKFKTKSGEVGWRTVRPDAKGYVDLAAFHGAAAKDSVSYLVAEVESPAAQDAEVLLGTDDEANLYLNGQQVHAEKVTRAAAPEQARVPVKLKPGRNAILLKIANGGGPHGFYLTILSPQELKLTPTR
jgi:putative membrane-bound dehydrogenase-like protein